MDDRERTCTADGRDKERSCQLPEQRGVAVRSGREQYCWEEDRIIRIIAEHLNLDPEENIPETGLYSFCDELDVIEMVIAVEEETGIRIPDEALRKLSTVGDVLFYAEKAVKEKEEES